MKKILIIITAVIFSITVSFTATNKIMTYLAPTVTPTIINSSNTQVLSATDSINNESVTFNVDAIFNKALIVKGNITADNIVYGIKAGVGVGVDPRVDPQNPVITNTGVLSVQGKTGELKLEQGSGITIDGLKITNSGIISLTSGTGITVSGSTITNSDLGSSQNIFKTVSVTGQDNIVAGSNTDTLTFAQGSGITLTTDSTTKKLTITSNDPSIAGGWTHAGTDIHLTTSTDQVGIGTTDPSYKLHVVGTEYVSDTLTAGGALSVTGNTTLTGALNANGNVTLGNSTSDSLTFVGRITNGTSLTPDTDLGSDLGNSSLRFENLWVANIYSNDSVDFSGKTVFSYAPTNTTISQSSVLINPTTSTANGQLLGLGIAGYQKALIDKDGDIILGYSNLTSAPVTDYPLTVYGHNGTNVASIDTSGNLSMGTGLTSSGALSMTTSGDFSVNTNNLFIESTNGKVGIGSVTPAQTLTVVGDLASSVATGVEGLKLTDTTDVTKLAMKWTGTGVTLDVPSLSTVNQLTNGTFESDITTGGWNQYSLNDQFTTSAPTTLVSGVSGLTNGGVVTPTLMSTGGPLNDGNLVTNGTFDSSSSWSLGTGVSVANGIITASSATSWWLSQNGITGPNNWYKLTFDILTQTSGSVGLLWDNTYYVTLSGSVPGTRTGIGKPTNGHPNNTNLAFYSSFSGTIDNVVLKKFNDASLFSTVAETTTNKIVSAGVTLTAGTQAGVVVNLDNASSPTNFVIAYHDGTKAHLDKVVNGTYTSLIYTTATYSAGATIKVIKNGNVYKLVYNGTQIGADQTISDAGIVAGTLQGLFSTYASNSFTNFLITTNLDGTSAEPTGGTRTVVDTGNRLSITGGQLSFSGGASAWGNPKIIYDDGFARAAGKTFLANLNRTTGGGVVQFGTNTYAGASSISDGLYFHTGNNILYAVNSGTNVDVASNANANYQLALVTRGTGMYYYIKGGTYTNWTLLWISSLGSGATIRPGIFNYSDVLTADNIRIPTSTWLPTPLAYSTFTTDGSSSTETTGPDGQTTPVLTLTGGAVASGALTITPTEVPSIIVNGAFDADSDWTKGTGWTIGGNVASSTAVSSSSLSAIVNPLTVGKWYLIGVDALNYSSGTLRVNSGIGNGSSRTSNGTSTAIDRATGTSFAVQAYLGYTGDADNAYAKELTLSSLFSTVPTSDTDVIVDTGITAVSSPSDGTYTKQGQAGIVTNLNNATTPTAGIVSYLERTNASTTAVVTLDKFTTATTWTNLIPETAVTYSAGATLRVITYTSGTDLKVRVYYNNALVGTEQTVSDSAIKSNTIHGLFSTNAGNSFDNFTLWARGTGNEYVNLPDTDLTATKDTSVHYSGTSSLKLAAGTSDNGYTQAYTLPNTNNYTLSAFAYTDGSAVTSSDLSLENGNVNLTTTYTSVGNGWYKLSASFAGVASSQNYGVKVKAGKIVYIDNISLFASSGGINVLAVSNSTTGLGGLSVESTTTLNSGLASLQALIVKGFSGQTANLQEWQDSTGTVLASISPTGGLTLAGNLDINGTTNDIAGTLNLSGNALTSSGALSISPNAGSNLNVVLSGTGDFKVNTNDLVVDTSTGRVGVGSSDPNSKLDVVSTTEQLRLGYDSSNYWSNTVGISGGLTMQGVGTGGSLTLSPTAGQNVNIALSGTGDFAVNSNDLVVDTSSGFVGINTTAPTALLDLAGTSGVDAFRLTNAGTKVLGLKYETNSTTFDQTSTDPTNKLLNPTFDSDLTSWSEVPSYTLNDQFTTDRAAGAVNGTSAEPTGGTRSVSDASNTLSISGSTLSASSSSGGSPRLAYPALSRTSGQLLLMNYGVGGNQIFGLTLSNDFTGNTGNLFQYISNLNIRDGGSIFVSVGTTAGTQYAIVTRSSGAYYFVKGEAYTNWTLIWAGSTYSGASLQPAIMPYGGTYTADNIRIPTSTWLPTPLAYDTFDTADLQTKTTGPDSQTTTQLAWTGGSDAGGVMTITPSLGGEMVSDVGFDASGDWTTDTGWSVSGNMATKTAGTASNITNVNGTSAIVDTWYYLSADLNVSVASQYMGIGNNNTAFSTTTGVFTQVGTVRASNTTKALFRGNATFAGTIDNFSIKPLTLSSLFSTVSTSDTDVIADADVTVTAGTQAGIVTNLNDTTTPTNFRIIYTDGTTIKMDDVVGGTYTNKLSVLHSSATALNYAAGRTLRVITQGTTMRVYYNNTLVGSEITTLGANTNTKHGLFSTYELNSFDNFVLWPRGSGTTKFNDAPFEELTATRNTTYKYNNSTASVQLVASGVDANYVQSVNVTDTQTYNLIAYAYTNGTAVTSTDLSLYYGSTTLTTSYTAMGGSGWYKLTGTLTGEASAKDYGVRVKAGKTVYVDEMHLQVGTGTNQTMYVMNSNTGVTGLNVQGLVNGTLSGVATFSKAGTISDADFTSPVDGLIGLGIDPNTSLGRIYFREGGAWSFVAQSGGFQIPKEEVEGLLAGDFLMPYVDTFMSDGAIHGLYQKFDLNKLLKTQGAVEFVSDVTFLGKTVFNKDTAGTAIISTYSSSVDVKFENTYETAPAVKISLVVDSSDSAYIEDGQKAYIANITPYGFSIMLPSVAIRNYTYDWIAINTNEENTTKSQSPIQQIIDNVILTITPTPLLPTASGSAGQAP